MTAVASSNATVSPSRWTLPVVLVAQFVTPTAIAGTAIALPLIARDLGSEPVRLQWVVNGFNVAFALGALLWGGLSDRIGHRMTFTLGALLVTVGSALSALASGLLLLDGARIVAGLGAAAILTGASSMLSNSFEGPKRMQAFAVFGTVNGLGLALGPTISGLLIAVTGWRGVFAFHAVILAFAVLFSRVLPASREADHSGGPLLDFTLLKNREFLAMCLVPVAGSIGFVTLLTYLPSAFAAIKDVSAQTAGLLMLAATIPVFVAPVVVGHLVSRFRVVTVAVVVYASLVSLVLANLGVLLLTPQNSIALVIVPMVLLGLGFGLPIGLVDGHALSVVPKERAGSAAGLLNFFRIGSEAVFVAFYAWILAAVVSSRLGQPAADETASGQFGHPQVYYLAFATTVGVLIALLALVTITIVLVRHRAKEHV